MTLKSFQLLLSLITALRSLSSSGFSEDLLVFPQPLSHFQNTNSTPFSPFILPAILVPPEVIEIDSLEIGGSMFEENKSIKKEELPRFFMSLFDNEVLWASLVRYLRMLSIIDYS